MQEKRAVGWKRTSKHDVVSDDLIKEFDCESPSTELTVGVGETDMRMRAMESAGISQADDGTGFNEMTRSAASNIARSKTTSG